MVDTDVKRGRRPDRHSIDKPDVGTIFFDHYSTFTESFWSIPDPYNPDRTIPGLRTETTSTS